MDLGNIVSGSREKLSEIRDVMGGIIDDESTLIEKKEKLEDKVDKLPVSGKQWEKFSEALDDENVERAEHLINRYSWSDETSFEVAKIYANMTYFEAEIILSDAQKFEYKAAEVLRKLEEHIEEVKHGEATIDKSKIVQMYKEAESKLKDAENSVENAEKEFERSRAAINHFKISGELAEILEKKEEKTDRIRKEIKGVMEHLMKINEEIT